MIWWLTFILFEVFRNWWMIVRKKWRPYYQWSAVIRLAAGFFWILYMHPLFDPGTLSDWLVAGPLTVFALTSFYLLFDPLLNLSRKLRWDYKGENSGWTDKLNPAEYHGLKVACLVFLILSSIAIYG